MLKDFLKAMRHYRMLDSRQKLGMEPPLVTDSVDVSFYRVLPGVIRSMTGAEHLLVTSVNVLARLGCHDHAPPMGGLQQQKLVSSQSWRLEVGDQGWRDWFHLTALSLACRRRLLPVSSRVYLLLLEGRQSYGTTAQPTLLASFLPSLPLYRSYLQIQSQAEVMGLGLQHMNLGGRHNSSRNS